MHRLKFPKILSIKSLYNVKNNNNLKKIKKELPQSKEAIMLQAIYAIRLAGQKLSRMIL